MVGQRVLAVGFVRKYKFRRTARARPPAARGASAQAARRGAGLPQRPAPRQAPAGAQPHRSGLEGARTDGARPRASAASAAGAAQTRRPPPQRALAPPLLYTDPGRPPRRLGTEGPAPLAGAARAGGRTQPRAGACKKDTVENTLLKAEPNCRLRGRPRPRLTPTLAERRRQLEIEPGARTLVPTGPPKPKLGFPWNSSSFSDAATGSLHQTPKTLKASRNDHA
ncbi:translation initiation factor IF-2-like [Mustela erminea]|uniref:translation initiation factor IF-2-like n=1 Tax=Mustela erminea TaxID=36723 RepID=UPI001386EB9C|nr:translation initiation factor IF-2-like [Mustela erminea]